MQRLYDGDNKNMVDLWRRCMQRLYDGIIKRGLPVETLHATSLRWYKKIVVCL
jgi:hypothetical protein